MGKEYDRRREALALARAQAKQRYDRAKEDYQDFLSSNSEHKLVKLPHERHILALCRDKYESLNEQMRYMRPSTSQDISYRERQARTFADQVSNLVPDDLPLRFHGCPIYEAERNIARGEILSWQERLGLVDPDAHVQISVADQDTLSTHTLRDADLQRYDLPAGCIFVLTPEDSRDEAMGRFHEMDSVNFRNVPDRLVAVITTPENKPRLNQWLEQADIPIQKGMTYDDFTNNIQQVIHSVAIPYRNRLPKAPLHETMDKLVHTPLDSLLQSATARATEQRSQSQPHRDWGR